MCAFESQSRTHAHILTPSGVSVEVTHTHCWYSDTNCSVCIMGNHSLRTQRVYRETVVLGVEFTLNSSFLHGKRHIFDIFESQTSFYEVVLRIVRVVFSSRVKSSPALMHFWSDTLPLPVSLFQSH